MVIAPLERTEMGARVMTTLTVTKEVDASSPNLTVGTGPELTEDELNHVSGDKGKYMEVKLKEIFISGVQS
jgi:type VI protein secretion system component Hcp